MRFLHAADLHLDSPLLGLARYEGAPVELLRGATRRALENLVQLAIDQQVDFVVIAGDLYDGDWKDHNTGLFFVGQMARLKRAGIPVVMIYGNHDAVNKMTRSLRLHDGKTIFVLRHERPETVKLEKFQVAIHGQSFADGKVTENLSLKYPAAEAGWFNIGLLHTSLAEATVPSREGQQHDRYAPCSLHDLKAKGYQYWALGHIHKRETICEEPYVVYPGNIQGRHARELDEKGCMIVEVNDRQQVTGLKFEPLDVVRWRRCEISVAGLSSLDEALDAFREELHELGHSSDLPLAVRVVLQGATPLFGWIVANTEQVVNELRAVALADGPAQVWLEKIELEISPEIVRDTETLRDGPLAEIERIVRQAAVDDELLDELAKELKVFGGQLPRELLDRQRPDALPLDDREFLRHLLGEVEPLLVARLSGGSQSA